MMIHQRDVIGLRSVLRVSAGKSNAGIVIFVYVRGWKLGLWF
jgi:hypothetical protein